MHAYHDKWYEIMSLVSCLSLYKYTLNSIDKYCNLIILIATKQDDFPFFCHRYLLSTHIDTWSTSNNHIKIRTDNQQTTYKIQFWKTDAHMQDNDNSKLTDLPYAFPITVVSWNPTAIARVITMRIQFISGI